MLAMKFKIMGKSKDFEQLDRMAESVNEVWNYCVNVRDHVWKEYGYSKFLHYGDGRRLVECYGRKTKFKVDESLAKEMGAVNGYVKYPKGPKLTKEQKLAGEMDPEDYLFIYDNPHGRSYGKGPQTLRIKSGFITSYDIQKLLTGSSEDLGLSSGTLACVADKFETAVKNKTKKLAENVKDAKGKAKKPKSFIDHRRTIRKGKFKASSPWIPFKGPNIKFNPDTQRLRYAGLWFKVNVDRVIIGRIASGDFVKHADGWYVHLVVDQATPNTTWRNGVGILGVDLGLKHFLTTSKGDVIDIEMNPTIKVFGRTAPVYEAIRRLASRGDLCKENKKKYKHIRNKIKRLEQFWEQSRERQHYEIAHKLCDMADTIICGDLSGRFIQVSFGKKSKKVSLGKFKERLEYIGKKRGVAVHFVNEQYTTVTCSACGERTGPSGTEGLNIREWQCKSCGANHDRDVNAAKNIASLKLPELSKAV